MPIAKSLQDLPNWPYAGQQSTDAPVLDTWKESNWYIAQLPGKSADHDSFPAPVRYRIGSEGHLIPDYVPSSGNREERNRELFNRRIQRFFESTGLRADVEHTAEEINAEIADFDAQLKAINAAREGDGLQPFSLSTPYREMSQKERALMNTGANVAGHAVNRLGRLGNAILDHGIAGNRLEYASTESMEALNKEFLKLYLLLTGEEHEALVRCVVNRDGRVDHDRAFHHLIRELSKPVMEYMRRKPDMTPEEQENFEQAANDAEQLTRNNIVIEISHCLGAIDETYRTMQVMTDHSMFEKFIGSISNPTVRSSKGIVFDTKELDPANYKPLLDEYVQVCRARACIRSEDAKNFNPVENRLRFLQSELSLYHGMMFRAADALYKHQPTSRETALETLSLLKRGSEIMGEMAGLRLPRNNKANGIYDTDAPEFEGRDASTVGRYKEKVRALENGRLQGTQVANF